MSTYDFSEFRERRQTTVWHTLNKLVLILILLAGSVMAVLYFLPEVRYLRDMKNRRDTLQTEKDTKSAEVKKNHRVEELLKNDPEYVETIARDKLDLMKSGETIIRMDTPSPAPAPVASGSESD